MRPANGGSMARAVSDPLGSCLASYPAAMVMPGYGQKRPQIVGAVILLLPKTCDAFTSRTTFLKKFTLVGGRYAITISLVGWHFLIFLSFSP